MAGKKKKTRAASRSDLAWLFSDLPADAEKLRFEFEPLAKTLAELALNPGNKTPFTVVVRRGWGRGKTTLLKRAQRMVEKPAEHRVTEAPGLRRVETLWFNAWKYPDEDTVLAGLLGALLDKLHRGGWKSQLKALVAEYRGSVLAAALKAAAPPGLKELLDVESKFGPAEEKRAFYDAFRQLFAEVSWILFHGEGAVQDLKGRDVESLWTEEQQEKHVLAVFLDDLDRCSKKRVVEVLQAVNLFLDLPGVCFFLGIDGDRLQKVLPEAVRDEGEEFLEKMIQVAFDLPEVATGDAEGYIEALVAPSPLAAMLEPAAAAEDLAPVPAAPGGKHPIDTGYGRGDAWVIAQALTRRHPRHVKRFLNDLSMGLAVLRSAERLGDASPALPPAAVLGWHLLAETLPPEKWAELRTQPELLRPFLGQWQELSELRGRGFLDRHVAALAVLDDAQISALHLASPPALEPKRHRAPRRPDLLDPDSDYWRELDSGQLEMGADDLSYREKPIHTVRLSRFAMARYPVTNADYRAYVLEAGKEAPNHWEEGRIPEERSKHPVVNVSWTDAAAFCSWATRMMVGRGTVRLPTEAEWEYAARGTEGRKYPWGDEEPDEQRANFGDMVGSTTPVGSYPGGATPEGIQDLAGNVWEWCHDWFGPYSKREQSDPVGPGSGDARVLRGGAFLDASRSIRSANRYQFHADYRYLGFGFRVVLSLS